MILTSITLLSSCVLSYVTERTYQATAITTATATATATPTRSTIKVNNRGQQLRSTIEVKNQGQQSSPKTKVNNLGQQLRSTIEANNQGQQSRPQQLHLEKLVKMPVQTPGSRYWLHL